MKFISFVTAESTTYINIMEIVSVQKYEYESMLTYYIVLSNGKKFNINKEIIDDFDDFMVKIETLLLS